MARPGQVMARASRSPAAEDASTVIYADPSGPGGVLSLDPGAWQRDLCGTIGNRTFTAEERRSLPVRVPAQPVCPAG